MNKMSEDFDIYADLEHIEKEAKQESHEVLALQQTIKELEEKRRAAEQEKTDIIRKNKILLENVSSLLLTAKAEIQRKDATISDLRKQCDNAVFRRNKIVANSVNYEPKFTQTPVKRSVNVGVQTLPLECSNHFQSKRKIDEGRDPSHTRYHEHDAFMHKSEAVPERDRSHGRDRTTNREKDRHRDHRYSERDLDQNQERNRNRDRHRYHDSDREHDRDRHSERHNQSLREKHHSHKEHRSHERDRFKKSHNVSGKKDPKPYKGLTSDKDRSSCEKHVPDRHRPNAEGDRRKSKPRLSDHKQGHLAIEPRTPEVHDSKKYDTVKNTDLNHTTKIIKQKNIETKLQEITSNVLEPLFHQSSPLNGVDPECIQQLQDNQTEVVINSYQPQKPYSEDLNSRFKTNDKNVHLSECTVLATYTLAGSKNDGPSSIDVSGDLILKSANLNEANVSSVGVTSGDARGPIGDAQESFRSNVAENQPPCNISNELNTKKDIRNKSSKRISKTEHAYDVLNDASTVVQEKKLCLLNSSNPNDGRNTSPLKCERKNENLEFSQCNTFQTNNSNEGHPNQSQELASSTATTHADPTAPVSVIDTLAGSKNDGSSSNNGSDNLILKSTTLDEVCSISVGTVESCRTLVDMARKGDRAESSNHSNAATNHYQISITSEPDRRKDKRNIPSKRKSQTEPANHVQNDDRPNASSITHEQKDDNLEPSQYDTIRTNNTDEAHEIHTNQPQKLTSPTTDPTVPASVTNALAGGKSNGPNSMEVSDNFVMKPASLDTTIASSASVSVDDACIMLLDMIHNEAGKESSKDIGSNVTTNHPRCNITNVKKSSKGKSRTKSTSAPSTSVQNDVSTNKVPPNELCENKPVNVELNLLSRERRIVENSGSSQYDLMHIKNTANEVYDITITSNTNESTCSIAIEEKDRNETANELLHKHNLDTDVVKNSVPIEISHGNNLSMTANNDLAAKDSQQQTSSISEPISPKKINPDCMTLRDRRSNSYSSMLESSTNHLPASMTMSIQTYFNTFNEQDDNEKGVEEENLSTNVETVALNVATEVEIETNSTPSDATSMVRNKLKASTADVIRERLRKRLSVNVQKAALPNEIKLANISSKRRLSIDSAASISDKKQKIETAALVDANKRSCVRSPKLSPTYFSQIALPITSALDSIPSNLKSPNVKHSAWNNKLMTPMVVVHSPAKPSQDTNQDVPNYYSSCPSDSSLQNIMHSLFQTPIKNEAPDRVSPPCTTNVSNCDDGHQQILTADHENVEKCSIPIGTKPFATSCSFKNEDHTTNVLSRKLSHERKQSIVPVQSSAARQSGVSSIDETRKKVNQKTSEHVQRAHLTSKNTTRSGKRLVDHITSTETQLESGASMSKVLEMAKRPENNDAHSTLIHDHQTNEKVKPVKPSVQDDIRERQKSMTNSDTFEKSETRRNIQKSKKGIAEDLLSISAPSANNSTTIVCITTSDEFPAQKLVESSRKRSQNQTNDHKKRVDATKNKSVEPHLKPMKGGKDTFCHDENTQPVERSFTQPIPCCSKSINEPQKADAQCLIEPWAVAPLKRRKNMQRVNPEPQTTQPVDRNSTQPILCASKNIEEPQKTDPKRLEKTSTVVPVNGEHNMERLNPETNAEQLLVPVNATPASNTQVPGRGVVSSTCIVSNVTLNLSLADNTSSNHNSVRKSATQVQHVREMRIVKESPSLMRIYIKRK